MTRLEGLRSPFNSNRAFAASLAMLLLAMPLAEARITKIEIDAANSQNPTFGGRSFEGPNGVVGQYEKISARAYGEVDPADPHNSMIVDIGLAPTNPSGKIEYSINFTIVKPVDLSTGSHRLFTLPASRGTPGGLADMIGGRAAAITPTSVLNAVDAGSALLMRRGFTILIAGWDVSVDNEDPSRYSINVPVARNPDGSAIVGRALAELAIDDDTTTIAGLLYPAGNMDRAQATLTFRVRAQDRPTVIPSSGWEYVNARLIRLAGRATFQRGLYEFVYPARDPVVAGLGLVALRDIMSFLRNATSDDFGHPNPLAGDVQHVYAHCISLPCRMMHDYVHLGFNQDEDNRQVIDGVLNWIGGGNFLKLNYRFAQPPRTHRQHLARWYPEFEFPFSNAVLTDSVTGTTDGRFNRCLTTSTCPKWFEVNSENEYWSKAASNQHFDRLLGDLPDPPLTRLYHMASLPHSFDFGTGICQQFQSPLKAYPVLRALFVALDEWVTDGTEPPASRVPRFDQGTLVRPLPQTVTGFPVIPARPAVPGQDTGLAVKYNGRLHTGDLFDYGPRYLTEGIIDILPPSIKGAPYPVLVPKNDRDGNNIAGIRLPEVAVPTATYTGWGLRALPAGGDDGCDGAGQKIPFRATRAGRLAIGDPRPSLEERYASKQDYIDKVTQAARDLQSQRLMLQEDVDEYADDAGAGYDLAVQATP